MPRWKSQPWRRDSNQMASGKPGAVQFAGGVIEHAHDGDLFGLSGRRHAQVGAPFGPGSGQIGMRQRLALVGEEEHNIAGFGLCLAQRQAQTDARDSIGILAALQSVSRPAPAEFF